jgi:hypothetical protein
MDRKKALIAGVGAACAGALGYVLSRRMFGGKDEPGRRNAPALTMTRPPGPIGDSGSARPAGPDAMRDPPKNWSRVDEALDQSYPASDPANLNPHID